MKIQRYTIKIDDPDGEAQAGAMVFSDNHSNETCGIIRKVMDDSIAEILLFEPTEFEPEVVEKMLAYSHVEDDWKAIFKDTLRNASEEVKDMWRELAEI